jgi:hypothetical protein
MCNTPADPCTCKTPFACFPLKTRPESRSVQFETATETLVTP